MKLLTIANEFDILKVDINGKNNGGDKMCVFIDGIGNQKKPEDPFDCIEDEKNAEDKPPASFFLF